MVANGFFDERTAGFDVAQKCTTAAGRTRRVRPTYPNPFYPTTSPASYGYDLLDDRLAEQLQRPGRAGGNAGLPVGRLAAVRLGPKGIYWDFDNDPTTDADIVAWWNGSAWVKNYDSGFAPVSAAEFNAWASDKTCGTASAPYSCYAIDTIEDALNLGINYTLKVGDSTVIKSGQAKSPSASSRSWPPTRRRRSG